MVEDLIKATVLRVWRNKPGSDKGAEEESPDYLCLREYNHRVPMFRDSPAKA